jgi:hypothetical protein
LPTIGTAAHAPIIGGLGRVIPISQIKNFPYEKTRLSAGSMFIKFYPLAHLTRLRRGNKKKANG